MPSPKPHESLEGLELPGGWKVTRRIHKRAGDSGGHFSCGYVAERDGVLGYVKALDFFSRLPEAEDPSRALEPLLKAFNFERDLLEKCRKKKLSRIVTALGDGSITVPGFAGPATVQFIVFELAVSDVRALMNTANAMDVAWALRALHQIALGLDQLHGTDIAHQDLKPSNVLLFGKHGSSKLGDLGRAALKGEEPPHYGAIPAGDCGYAPPEFLYGSVGGTWDERRRGCDAYHLGSMIASLFTTVAMTPLVMMSLDPRFRWHAWGDTFEAVLPILRPAFAEAYEYVAAEIPPAYRANLSLALKQLCEPDPRLRGHPKDRAGIGSSFALRRYVSLFNRLARQAEIRLGRSHRKWEQ